MSEHVEVFKINKIERLPQFDKLGLIHFYEYPCLIGLSDFKEGDLAAYIPPDFVVPDTPDFAFLGSHKRIRAKKLKGIISQGLVIKAPPKSKVGDNVTDILKITKYVPKINTGNVYSNSKSSKWLKYSEFEAGPPIQGPYYDIESFYRYSDAFIEGEEVIVTEKIHGTNARFTWQNGRLWVASRSGYRKSAKRYVSRWQKFLRWATNTNFPENLYWRAVEQNQWIENWFKNFHSDYIFYGEIYGDVQDLTYGAKNGEYRVRIFDLFHIKEQRFLDANEFLKEGHEFVPEIYRGPYSKEHLKSLISGPSLIPGASHIREGIVIRPVKERFTHNLGRTILKAVSPEYLERTKE